MVTPFTKYFCKNGYSRTIGPVATTVMASFIGSLGTSLAGMPLRAAAALMEQGIDFQALNKRHFRTKSVARMKLESLIIEHMHLYHNGTVAVAPISLELIARAGATSDEAKRTELYYKAQTIMCDEALLIPLNCVPATIAARNNVTGVVQTPLGNYLFNELTKTA